MGKKLRTGVIFWQVSKSVGGCLRIEPACEEVDSVSLLYTQVTSKQKEKGLCQ